MRRTVQTCFLVLAMPLTLALSGCGKDTGQPKGSGSQGRGSAAGKQEIVELKKVTVDQLQAAIQEHKGKVVLVDVWGTACIPCIQKFPKFVALHNKYAKQGLTCISVATQSPKQDAALKFLQKQKATFPNYIVEDNVETTEKLFAALGINGAIPATFLYDVAGKKVKSFDGSHTFDQIEAEVKKLLPK